VTAALAAAALRLASVLGPSLAATPPADPAPTTALATGRAAEARSALDTPPARTAAQERHAPEGDAASQTPPRVAVEDELVVVAERRPLPLSAVSAAVSTLDAAALARLPAVTVAEAVATLPGFHVLFDAPFGGVPMEAARGFFGGGEAGYVQLRVDGVPLADVESGAAEWSALPVAAISRVEALRGPAAPLYGDSAFGGVVELRTRAAGEPPALAAALSGGSFGTVAADARATGFGRGLAAALDVDARRTGGYREHAAEEHGGARLRLAPASPAGATSWTVNLDRLQARREDPGPLTLDQIAVDRRASDPLFRDDRTTEERWSGTAAWRRAGAVESEARLTGERRELASLRTLLLAAGFGDRTWRRLDSDTLGAAATASGELLLPGGGGGWTAGGELSRDRLDSAHHTVLPNAAAGDRLAAATVARQRRAAFAAASWDPAARLRLSAALRWDAVRDSAGTAGTAREAWSPRAGITVRPRCDREWILFGQWGKAFKAPTLDQLFDPRPFPDGAGGSFALANPGLRPQRARTVEVGARGFGPGASWQLSLYRTGVEDEIDFDPATFRYLNLGESLHRGVELAGDLVRHRRGRLGAAWEWGEVFARTGEHAGRQLKNVPEHTFRLIAETTLPGSVEAALTGRHLTGRFLDDAHQFPLGDATVVDLRLRRRSGAWEAHLDVRNLLGDDFLWVGYALPDSTALVPYAFPGHDRAVMVGLRWTGERSP
jgi:outer membrane receptor protein involved in Fe transport